MLSARQSVLDAVMLLKQMREAGPLQLRGFCAVALGSKPIAWYIFGSSQMTFRLRLRQIRFYE